MEKYKQGMIAAATVAALTAGSVAVVDEGPQQPSPRTAAEQTLPEIDINYVEYMEGGEDLWPTTRDTDFYDFNGNGVEGYASADPDGLVYLVENTMRVGILAKIEPGKPGVWPWIKLVEREQGPPDLIAKYLDDKVIVYRAE